jgi:hypothetical protein
MRNFINKYLKFCIEKNCSMQHWVSSADCLTLKDEFRNGMDIRTRLEFAKIRNADS